MPEFRRRTVELARTRDKPFAQVAQDLGISETIRVSGCSQTQGEVRLTEMSMSLQDSVPTIVGMVGLCATVATGVALAFERVVHRSHLSQAEQDHRRLHRLSTRLPTSLTGV